MATAEAVADEAVNVVAILALAAVGATTSADPTLVVTAIAGLGGYRAKKRAKQKTAPSEGPPSE